MRSPALYSLVLKTALPRIRNWECCENRGQDSKSWGAFPQESVAEERGQTVDQEPEM